MAYNKENCGSIKKFNSENVKNSKRLLIYLWRKLISGTNHPSIPQRGVSCSKVDLNEFESKNGIFMYLITFLFLIALFKKLSIIINNWLKNDYLYNYFPLFYTIIKWFLFLLLALNLVFLILLGKNLLIMGMSYLKKHIIKMNISDKFKDLKLSLEYKVKNNSPRKPKMDFISNWINKKKDRKKASLLKEKLLHIQKRNLENNYNNLYTNSSPLSDKRNWNNSINIENNPKFTTSDQLENIKYEFKAYHHQENKFKKIVVDINNNKEKFYPSEAQNLFKEYVSVVKILKKNLKSVEKNLRELKKKNK